MFHLCCRIARTPFLCNVTTASNIYSAYSAMPGKRKGDCGLPANPAEHETPATAAAMAPRRTSRKRITGDAAAAPSLSLKHNGTQKAVKASKKRTTTSAERSSWNNGEIGTREAVEQELAQGPSTEAEQAATRRPGARHGKQRGGGKAAGDSTKAAAGDNAKAAKAAGDSAKAAKGKEHRTLPPSGGAGASTMCQGPRQYEKLNGCHLFLLKSEPDDFSIDDLAAAGEAAGWEGVRNAQACKTLKSMKLGDLALFYHSSCKHKGVVGIAEVVREAYPDSTSWDPDSKYYDERSTAEAPRWFMVDVKLVRKLARCISLEELKQQEPLHGMDLLTRPRLSVQRVSPQHWQHILGMEAEDQPA